MATPKKKTSVSRKGLRRAGQTHKLYRKHPATCSNCREPVLSHSICPACGHYDGKEIIKIKVDAPEATESESK